MRTEAEGGGGAHNPKGEHRGDAEHDDVLAHVMSWHDDAGFAKVAQGLRRAMLHDFEQLDFNPDFEHKRTQLDQNARELAGYERQHAAFEKCRYDDARRHAANKRAIMDVLGRLQANQGEEYEDESGLQEETSEEQYEQFLQYVEAQGPIHTPAPEPGHEMPAPAPEGEGEGGAPRAPELQVSFEHLATWCTLPYKWHTLLCKGNTLPCK